MRSSAPLIALVLASSLLGGCGGAGGTANGGKGGKCQAVDDARPTLPHLTPAELPTSTLWIDAKVPLASVTARIAKEVPAILAQEKDQDVGAPGKATYKVTRRTPELAIDKGKVKVRVPIDADISVCKPIGSMCIGYGSCRPSFVAEFSLSDSLGEKYELSPPRGTIRATKKCVIGVDVTSQIEKIAAQEVRQVERQIAGRWPNVLAEVEAGFAHLGEPLELAPEQCFYVDPDQLLVDGPRIETSEGGKFLALSMGARGRLTPAACDAEREPPRVVSPAKEVSPREPSRLWISEVVPWAEVKSSLGASLNGEWAGAGSALHVDEVLAGPSGLALRITTTGPLCGTYWVTADYEKGEGQANVRLVRPALATGSKKQTVDQERLDALYLHLTSRGKVVLEENPFLSPGAEIGLSNMIRLALPEEVSFSISPPTADAAQVAGTPEGLQVATPVRSSLTVSDL